MLMVRDWQTPLRKPWDLNQAQLMFSLQQTFVGKDKRDLRSTVAADDVEAASDDLETMRQDVSASVREASAVLMRNAEEMRLHNQQATVLNEALSAALAEYTTGKVPQADVLRAQMALTRLNEHLIQLEQERDAARAQLNSLMGRSPDEAIEITGTYTVTPTLPSIDELERIAIEHRPELAAMRKQITKFGDESKLARLAMKPDFTIAAGYMLMPTGSNSRSAYMAEATMNLPWLNRSRHDNETKQADAATDVAQAELDARTSTVFLEIRQAQIDVQSAQRRVKLYRDTLLPQAEAAFKASATAYQNNRGEFMNLVDSQNLLPRHSHRIFDSALGGRRGQRTTGASHWRSPPQRQPNLYLGKEYHMNTREKKLIVIGAAAGILATALAVGLVMGRGHIYAAEKMSATTTMPPAAPAPQAAADEGTQPGTTLSLTPAEITAAGVQIAEVRTAALKTDIDSFGRVEQPEAQLAAVSARIGGRVDKLYVQYTGENVRRGQAVADVYSPEVATAIADYHLAQENSNQLRQSDDPNARAEAEALITASQRKLELWGISEKQIQAPQAGGIPHVTIYASASGSVVDRKVTQGQYVNAGDTLFTVADLSQVWIKADVYEDQLPQIRRGQEVAITAEALPNRTLHGHVDFIEPQANPQTRTVPVHVHVANPGMRLLPGMFVSASFVSTAPTQSIVVPRSAVLDTGTRKIVYLARPNGIFEAREVAVGTPSDDLFPVTSGLAVGDKVVLSGNFLIDSQAHLSSGMSGMYGGSKEFAANSPAPASRHPAAGSSRRRPQHNSTSTPTTIR